MPENTASHASTILDKRWEGEPLGFVATYNRRMYRKTHLGWVLTSLTSDDKVHRLENASGLWKSDAAKYIGTALVIEAVQAARDEAVR